MLKAWLLHAIVRGLVRLPTADPVESYAHVTLVQGVTSEMVRIGARLLAQVKRHIKIIVARHARSVVHVLRLLVGLLSILIVVLLVVLYWLLILHHGELIEVAAALVVVRALAMHGDIVIHL